MSEDDGMRRFVVVDGLAEPARDGYTIGATVQMTQDELYGPEVRQWPGRRRRVTWLKVIKGGQTRSDVRLDRDQALTLAEAIIGLADGTGLLTRDQAIRRVALMIQAWAITHEELEAEQVIRALGGALGIA